MTAIRKVTAARVLLWGSEVGAVAWEDERQAASFEFTPAFLRSGYDISPIMLPRREGIFSFPELNSMTYHGLPGLLADSLPDRFGNALIDAWLARQGRPKDDFSPVERLCYIASRGMGALEFKPALRRLEQASVPLEIEEMVKLAQYVIDRRSEMLADLHDQEKAVDTIIRIGTSAGGARAKAIIAWNRKTHEIRSGQVPPPAGFEPWIMKFDGLKDRSLGLGMGYGRVEYAYHLMAGKSGIRMAECGLFEEGGRAHFMTKRFDRDEQFGKLHLQSLCALGHFDFNMPGATGYEEAIALMLRLGLGYDALEEFYRRMLFNVVARNQDDHTKNTAFLMDRSGRWSLSPAYDVIWAFNPESKWTNRHQMTINGKRDGFTRDDLLSPARQYGIRHAAEILDNVVDAVRSWRTFADAAGVPPEMAKEIAATHRLEWQ